MKISMNNFHVQYNTKSREENYRKTTEDSWRKKFWILTFQHSVMQWESTGLKLKHLHSRTLPQDHLAVQPEMANPQE
jgi:hypothetical protein